MSDKQYVEVTEADLPLTCPRNADVVWNAHPKVRLVIDHKGEAHCPYCGTSYKFKGELPGAHH